MTRYVAKYTVDVYATVDNGEVVSVHTGDEIVPTGEIWSGPDADHRVLDETIKAAVLAAADDAEWPVWDA